MPSDSEPDDVYDERDQRPKKRNFISEGAGRLAHSFEHLGLERIGYFITFLFWVIIAMVVKGVEIPFFDPSFLGALGVFRVSLALSLYFLVIWLLVSFSPIPTIIMKGHWGLKGFFMCVLYGLTFAIPISGVEFFAFCCQFTSAIFLFLQILYLIDFAWNWNANWANRDGNIWRLLLLVVSALILVGLVVALTIMWQAHSSSCSTVTIPLIITILLLILTVGVALFTERGALLHSMIVSTYIVYLMFSAQSSSQDEACWSYAHASNTWSTVISALVSLVALAYSAVSYGSKGETQEAYSEAQDDAITAYSPKTFCLTMLLASTYAAMLLTDWHYISATAGGLNIGTGATAFWVKLTSQWACALLYCYLVFAPYLFPDREFPF